MEGFNVHCIVIGRSMEIPDTRASASAFRLLIVKDLYCGSLSVALFTDFAFALGQREDKHRHNKIRRKGAILGDKSTCSGNI